MTPRPTSVCCARRARGLRNSGTAFAIASTPVSATLPDANAFSRSRMPTVIVVEDADPCGNGSGCERTRPPMMTAKIATMKMMVGAMNSRADSATPQRFAAVITASTTRHSNTRYLKR